MSVLFGYQGNRLKMYLHDDGTLAYASGGQRVLFRLSEKNLARIRDILAGSREMLRELGGRINGNADTDEENCFIFEDCRIIDWDLTRWYLEEDRRKHPDYYENTVRLELTENHVRGIFDEICEVLAEEDKRLIYSRTILGSPEER